MTIKGQTIKQLFKALEERNNLQATLGNIKSEDEYLNFIVYIDDCKKYVGHSWKEFKNFMDKEYVKTFNEILFKQYFCGSNVIEYTYLNYNTRVEIYIA